MWDVSAFMKILKQRFTQWFNKNSKRRGTLWEDRFRSMLVEGGAALGMMAAYIDLNSVRAGMVQDSADYRWSSYGVAMGGNKAASFRPSAGDLARSARKVPDRCAAGTRCGQACARCDDRAGRPDSSRSFP